MPVDLSPIHPELRAAWKQFPRLPLNGLSLPLIRLLMQFQPRPPRPADVVTDILKIPGSRPGAQIRLKVYVPHQANRPAPALLWIHGGGLVLGRPEQDDAFMIELAREVGLVVFSVDYRLAPEHPFPAPLKDCYTVLLWMHSHAARLGIDPARVAVGGGSAGGGLAAAVAQQAHDRGDAPLAFQLLVYPMLEPRSSLRTDVPHTGLLTWTQANNRFGWESYLGAPCSADETRPFAVPARRADLSGLPPAWIGVGTLDLFHEEDCAYAARLQASGVECELLEVPGAYHGFDALNGKEQVIADFHGAQVAALKKALKT